MQQHLKNQINKVFTIIENTQKLPASSNALANYQQLSFYLMF